MHHGYTNFQESFICTFSNILSQCDDLFVYLSNFLIVNVSWLDCASFVWTWIYWKAVLKEKKCPFWYIGIGKINRHPQHLKLKVE